MVSLIGIVTILPGLGRAAQEPFNIDAFFGWGGCFRPMEWTPIEIGIGSFLETPLAGTFHLSLPQDELNTLHIAHPVVLTPEVPLRLPLVGKMAFNIDLCQLRLTDEDGKRLWSRNINLLDLTANNMQPVHHYDLLIGVVGERRFGLLKLEEDAVSQTKGQQAGIDGNVYVRDKLVHNLPWDWTGYTSLDALICYDPDWSKLREPQWQALAQWVSQGGHLAIILGSHPWPGENALTEILPAQPVGLQQVTLAPTLLEKWSLPTNTACTLSVTPLRPRSPDRLSVMEQSGETVLSIEAPVGFGRVAMLGVDPRNLPESLRENSSAFWKTQLQTLLAGPKGGELGSADVHRTLQLASEESEESNTNKFGNQHFNITPAQQANNGILEHLYSIEQMRPLSIGWVIGLLLLLAILIGPVDYWVLKRLDRQPLTWITSSAWIILFTVGAYYGVQVLRTGDLQLRTVSVTDAIAGQPISWQTHYCGIFAPKSDDYPLAGLTSDQWWSGMAPSRNHLSRYGGQFGRRDIFCVQQNGANLPVSLPINIWTMQCLMKESPGPPMPLSVEWSQSGNTIRLSVTNHSEQSFERCALVFPNRRGLKLKPLAPGETQSVTAAPQALHQWWQHSGSRPKLPLSDLFTAEGCLARTQAMESYLDSGAALLVAERFTDSTPFRLTSPSYSTEHVEVLRAVVFPHDTRTLP